MMKILTLLICCICFEATASDIQDTRQPKHMTISMISEFADYVGKVRKENSSIPGANFWVLIDLCEFTAHMGQTTPMNGRKTIEALNEIKDMKIVMLYLTARTYDEKVCENESAEINSKICDVSDRTITGVEMESLVNGVLYCGFKKKPVMLMELIGKLEEEKKPKCIVFGDDAKIHIEDFQKHTLGKISYLAHMPVVPKTY
ncbi:MAG: hypothetical protein ACPGXY_00400 [Alphaproteobacteria bacterium]